MARASSRLLATALFVSIAGALPAAADPIRITAGTLDISGLDPAYYRPVPIHLEGDRGFTLDAFTGSGTFAADVTCLYGCDPGQRVSLNATWGGLDLVGKATLDGRSYEHVGIGDEWPSAVVRFTAAVTVPYSSADLATVTAPFAFEGLFGPPFIDLVGGGTVTATFERPLVRDAGFYELRRTVFTFSPVVPEPGTLLLVATGLAAGMRGAMTRRRNTRRQE